ncbi:TMEM175 family protein [Hymenobacter sp. BT730]|uniref:TMEM175 family protein n=1 Tax=Hymenobacter sp. BT730 TaxID=3063332 RepID=UPI0026E10E58|nr:TMEM175 family protein [Hymenobacter sp. BT730]
MFPLLDLLRRGALHRTRVEAFSDGVFAIVVTLLILEVRVPHLEHGTVAELKHGLHEVVPKVLSWAISFIVVCKFWINHSYIFSLARHSSYALMWINALFLMAQAFIPFPTALLGEYPYNPLAVSFFGVVLLVNTLLFVWMHYYINAYLLHAHMHRVSRRTLLSRSMVGPACYALGAGLAWVSVWAAFAVYLLTPLFFIVPLQPDHGLAVAEGLLEEPSTTPKPYPGHSSVSV